MSYPNLYREGSAPELYGDSEMYLKWRGPLREAARLQALQKLQPVFGEMLARYGYEIDDALNQSLMWTLAFGSQPNESQTHRVFAHNLLDVADAFRATLNMSAIHENVDFVMPEKIAQFLTRVDMAVKAGLDELANLPEMQIPVNVSESTPISDGRGSWIPIGALFALLSLLG